MQKMLTSVEGCPPPSLTSPAGEPVSVIVWAPPPAGPKAPEFRCSQSGQPPLPSVQSAFVAHALNVGWSHVPVPAPVQHLEGLPAEVHLLLCGHAVAGSPSKQPVLLASRQKPQKTLF